MDTMLHSTQPSDLASVSRKDFVTELSSIFEDEASLQQRGSHDTLSPGADRRPATAAHPRRVRTASSNKLRRRLKSVVNSENSTVFGAPIAEGVSRGGGSGGSLLKKPAPVSATNKRDLVVQQDRRTMNTVSSVRMSSQSVNANCLLLRPPLG